MITVSARIDRSPEVVWKYFTTVRHWSKWYGGGVKKINPSWQQGAKIIWETGEPSTITEFIAGKKVCSSSRWIDRTYTFTPEGSSATLFSIIESDPKGGASFSDGGAANKASLENSVRKFKELVERETNAAAQGEKVGFLSRLFGKKQPTKANNDVLPMRAGEYRCPHCGTELQGIELIILKKYIEGGVVDLRITCPFCKMIILKKDIDSALKKSG